MQVNCSLWLDVKNTQTFLWLNRQILKGDLKVKRITQDGHNGNYNNYFHLTETIKPQARKRWSNETLQKPIYIKPFHDGGLMQRVSKFLVVQHLQRMSVLTAVNFSTVIFRREDADNDPYYSQKYNLQSCFWMFGVKPNWEEKKNRNRNERERVHGRNYEKR